MVTISSTTAIEANKQKSTGEPRNLLITFLLTIIGGYIGLRHFYVGDKTLGWTRAALFIGGFAWIFTMGLLNQALLASLGVLAILITATWALIDFFYVFFSARVDAEGRQLTATARDRHWMKILFWAMSLAMLFLVFAGMAAASLVETYFLNDPLAP